jgi:hypothetical protein
LFESFVFSSFGLIFFRRQPQNELANRDKRAGGVDTLAEGDAFGNMLRNKEEDDPFESSIPQAAALLVGAEDPWSSSSSSKSTVAPGTSSQVEATSTTAASTETTTASTECASTSDAGGEQQWANFDNM